VARLRLGRLLGRNDSPRKETLGPCQLLPVELLVGLGPADFGFRLPGLLPEDGGVDLEHGLGRRDLFSLVLEYVDDRPRHLGRNLRLRPKGGANRPSCLHELTDCLPFDRSRVHEHHEIGPCSASLPDAECLHPSAESSPTRRTSAPLVRSRAIVQLHACLPLKVRECPLEVEKAPGHSRAGPPSRSAARR